MAILVVGNEASYNGVLFERGTGINHSGDDGMNCRRRIYGNSDHHRHSRDLANGQLSAVPRGGRGCCSATATSLVDFPNAAQTRDVLLVSIALELYALRE